MCQEGLAMRDHAAGVTITGDDRTQRIGELVQRQILRYSASKKFAEMANMILFQMNNYGNITKKMNHQAFLCECYCLICILFSSL